MAPVGHILNVTTTSVLGTATTALRLQLLGLVRPHPRASSSMTPCAVCTPCTTPCASPPPPRERVRQGAQAAHLSHAYPPRSLCP